VRQAAVLAVDSLGNAVSTPGVRHALTEILGTPNQQGNDAVVHALALLGPAAFTTDLLRRLAASLAEPAAPPRLIQTGLWVLWQAVAFAPAYFLPALVEDLYELCDGRAV
jgi:hypothetical protein